MAGRRVPFGPHHVPCYVIGLDVTDDHFAGAPNYIHVIIKIPTLDFYARFRYT
jgi:hypothetical protein